MPRRKFPSSHMQQDRQGWWFWDESETQRYGPFESRDKALVELGVYAGGLERVSSIDQVRLFHEIFRRPISEVPTTRSDDPTLQKLRLDLIAEELNELHVALLENNVLETLDALLDLQYVLDGAFLTFGLANIKDKALAEVHRSNMSKSGKDGKPIFRDDGKILKGPNYFKLDLAQFLKKPEETNDNETT